MGYNMLRRLADCSECSMGSEDRIEERKRLRHCCLTRVNNEREVSTIEQSAAITHAAGVSTNVSEVVLFVKVAAEGAVVFIWSR